MWTPGPIEIVIILIIAVLIFGKRLPEIGRSVGKSWVEFKKGISETENTKEKFGNETPRAPDLDQDNIKE